MIISDGQREENFQEYLRLLKNPNYVDVCFDERSGGVSAVHLEHQFDKSTGPFGYKRGQYELDTMIALRQSGHSIILEPELSSGETVSKSCDGFLDGVSAEIKAVESVGRWSIRTKIYKAKKQGAQTVILYFPEENLFSKSRVEQGLEDFVSADTGTEYKLHLLCVVGGKVVEIEKPSW
ncbi:MAG: hypothetical protein J6X71_05405 [Bacteroidales bacterium]|nr:hypothetical protein [Bacteroidales bacterium]